MLEKLKLSRSVDLSKHGLFLFQDLGKFAGLLMSVSAMLFSAFGNVFSKMLKGKIAKQDLSAYIGVSIFTCSLATSFFAEPVMWIKHEQEGMERYILLDRNPRVVRLAKYQHKLTNGVFLPCSFRRMSLNYFPGLNETDWVSNNDWPMTTNLTCLSEEIGHMMEGSLEQQEDLNITTILTNDLVESCQFVMPAIFPTNSSVWIKTIFVAILGALQQFFLIGKNSTFLCNSLQVVSYVREK